MSREPRQPLPGARTKIEGHLKRPVARSGADPRRKAELAAIHCLKRDLKLDDELYRDVLHQVAGVRSSAGLDARGRAALIEHLKGKLPGAAERYPGRPHNADAENRAELTKIEALLTDADKPWAYAEKMLKHMSKGRKLRLEFASPAELAAIIAALHKAAVKRLSAEMAAAFGETWGDTASLVAALLFNFDGMHRSIESYPEIMSQVLRWWRGELQAACDWPVQRESARCCGGCVQRLVAGGGRA